MGRRAQEYIRQQKAVQQQSVVKPPQQRKYPTIGRRAEKALREYKNVIESTPGLSNEYKDKVRRSTTLSGMNPSQVKRLYQIAESGGLVPGMPVTNVGSHNSRTPERTGVTMELGAQERAQRLARGLKSNVNPRTKSANYDKMHAENELRKRKVYPEMGNDNSLKSVYSAYKSLGGWKLKQHMVNAGWSPAAADALIAEARSDH